MTRASLPADATPYEQSQNQNWLIRWLHSFRYRHVEGVFDDLARRIPDRPIRVLELGSSEGKLFGLLDSKFSIDFVGIELRVTGVERSRARYGDRPNFRVVHGSAADPACTAGIEAPDVVVALETLEHIPEADLIRVVEWAASLGAPLVCSVPVEVGPAIWCKNVGSVLARYNRHLEYRWPETFWAGLYRLDRVRPHWIGHVGFDWRWLVHTLRHHYTIEVRRFPSRFLPAALSTSVFMVAAPRSPT